MSFGWSAGDVLAAATLVWKIGRALQESTGAAEKYRKHLQQLNGIELQLRILECVIRKYGKGHPSAGGSEETFLFDDFNSQSLQNLMAELKRLVGQLEEKILNGVRLGPDKVDKTDKKQFQNFLLRTCSKLNWEFFFEGDTKALIAEMYQLAQNLDPLYQQIDRENMELYFKAQSLQLKEMLAEVKLQGRRIDTLSISKFEDRLLGFHSSSQDTLIQVGPEEGVTANDALQALYRFVGIEFSAMSTGVSQHACNLAVDYNLKDQIASWLSPTPPPRLWLYGKRATTVSAILFKIAGEKGQKAVACASRHIDRKGTELSQEERLIKMVYSITFQLLKLFHGEDTLTLVDVRGSCNDLDGSMKTMPLALRLLKYFLYLQPHCIVTVDGWDFLSKADNPAEVNEHLRTFLGLFDHAPMNDGEMEVYDNRLLLTTAGGSPMLSSFEKDYLASLNVGVHAGRGPHKLWEIFQW